MYDGEVPNEKDDEHVSLTFIVKALGEKNIFFLSSMRLNKAFDAQNGTAKVWTVGPMMTMNSWSHAPAFHIVMTLTTEWCESVLCDGCVDIN